MRGEGIFKFFIRVPRQNSDQEDTLIVEVPERGSGLDRFQMGDRVYITGQFRSANRKKAPDSKPHLYLFIFADRIEHDVSGEILNHVKLRGRACKKPNLRLTSKGRDVCDVMLDVRRSYDRSDYLPVVVFGRNARYVSDFDAGQHFFIEGRIQSRKYRKKLSDDKVIERVAYEVSTMDITDIDPDQIISESYFVTRKGSYLHQS